MSSKRDNRPKTACEHPAEAAAGDSGGLFPLGAKFRFSDALRSRRPSRCQLIGPAGERLDVPEAVFHVIVKVAEVMAKGDAVTVVPVGKELTTQQAALLLNVSRQYLVRLLDQGVLPYRKTGKHRRLRVEDVLAYRERRDRERRADLDELSRYTEEIGGYNRE